MFLKLEVIKKIVGISALLATMNISVLAMAYSSLAVNIGSQLIDAWPNRELLDYGYLEQLKDILPTLLLTFFMGICVSFVSKLGFFDISTIFVQIVIGGFIYIGGSKLFRFESFNYILVFFQVNNKRGGDC